MDKVCTYNVAYEPIGRSCPECGHNQLVHPGSNSPAIKECLLCRLEHYIETVKDAKSELEKIEWDIDANLPMYTRDYLRLKKEDEEKQSFRASSLAKCPICLKTWGEHPVSFVEDAPTLRQACNGMLVKL